MIGDDQLDAQGNAPPSHRRCSRGPSAPDQDKMHAGTLLPAHIMQDKLRPFAGLYSEAPPRAHAVPSAVLAIACCLSPAGLLGGADKVGCIAHIDANLHSSNSINSFNSKSRDAAADT
jgi:hypothetical protein